MPFPSLPRALAALSVLVTAACAADAPPLSDVSPGRMVATGDTQTYVREWGDPGAPDVFLIHGAASHSGVFAPTLAPALGGNYHVAAYDRPGMGRTEDRPAGSQTLAAQAKAAAAAIEALGLQKPVVVAHSYGGAVALRLALDRPDLVSGLVLLSPASHPWPGGVAWHYHVSAAPLVGTLFNRLIVPLAGDGAVQSGLEGSFSPRPVPPGFAEAAEMDLALLPRALRANGQDMTALKAQLRAQAPLYPRIDTPVFVIAGDADDVVSTDLHSGALAKEIPGARLTLLPGVGHMTPEAAPDQTVQAVARILDETGGQ